MSEYFDLHCKTCNSSCGFHWNRGEKQLAILWNECATIAIYFEMLGRIGDAADAAHVSIEIDHLRLLNPESYDGGWVKWFDVHFGHDVAPISEYACHTCYARDGHTEPCAVLTFIRLCEVLPSTVIEEEMDDVFVGISWKGTPLEEKVDTFTVATKEAQHELLCALSAREDER